MILSPNFLRTNRWCLTNELSSKSKTPLKFLTEHRSHNLWPGTPQMCEKKIFRVQMYERALKCSIMIKNALQSSILLKFLKLPSTTWLSYFLQEGHSNSLSYQIIFLPVRLNTRNKARVFLFCKTVTSIFTKILTFFKIAPHFIYFTIRTLPITL